MKIWLATRQGVPVINKMASHNGEPATITGPTTITGPACENTAASHNCFARVVKTAAVVSGLSKKLNST